MSFRDRRGELILEGQGTDFKDKIVYFEGVNLIGRNPAKTTLTIKDKSISQIHGKIICRNNTIKIVDAKSKNGIYLNSMQNPIPPEVETQIDPKRDVVYFAQIKGKFVPDEFDRANEDDTKQFTVKPLKPSTKQHNEAPKDINQQKQESKQKKQIRQKSTKQKNSKRIEENVKQKQNKKTKKQQTQSKSKEIEQEKNQSKNKQQSNNEEREVSKKKETKKKGKKDSKQKTKGIEVNQPKQEEEVVKNGRKSNENQVKVEKNKQSKQQKEGDGNQKQPVDKKQKHQQNQAGNGSKDKGKERKQSKSAKEQKQKKSESGETKVRGYNSRKNKSVGKLQQNSKKQSLMNRKKLPESLSESLSNHPRRSIVHKTVLTSGFKLGFKPTIKITITENWRDCFDVLVMEKYSRTFKLLYAICLGIPVVTIVWIVQSEHRRGIVPFERFYLHGPQKQLIPNSIALTKQGYKVFKNLKFFIIQNQDPFHLPIDQIVALLEAGGGTVLKRVGKKQENKEVVFIFKLKYSKQDIKIAQKIEGACKFYTVEMILDSCLFQEIKWDQNKVQVN